MGSQPSVAARDTYGRRLRTLRVSLTDRCNLRCQYCMPEEDYPWLDRADLLSPSEIARALRILAPLGLDKIRWTGGEPLLRPRASEIIAMARNEVPASIPFALTTNGLELDRYADSLAAAGIAQLTLSIDTLRPDRFMAWTRRNAFHKALRGFEAAAARPWRLKTNTVVVRGFNDDEIVPIVRRAWAHGAEPRFIEYMDVGGATRWSPDAMVSAQEIRSRLCEAFGRGESLLEDEPGAPARRWRFGDGVVGIIASVTEPFCRDCTRLRLSADGQLARCLYAPPSFDLRRRLREKLSDQRLRSAAAEHWRERRDRSAEIRHEMRERAPAYDLVALRKTPHLEMHKRGG